MKIYVDVLERVNVGKKVLDKPNIYRTEELMRDRAHNGFYSLTPNDKVKIAQGYSIIGKLIDLYHTWDKYDKDPTWREFLPDIEKEIEEEKEHIRDNHFPHYRDITGVKEKDLNSYISQGDFVVINKQTTITEIKATWKTMKDALRNPKEIEETLERATKANLRYKLVVALPDNSTDEAEWRENNGIYQDDYNYFMKKMKINPRKVRMPLDIYREVCNDYFLDVDQHYKLLQEKQRRVLDKVISLSP
jgi:hypothetical protein